VKAVRINEDNGGDETPRVQFEVFIDEWRYVVKFDIPLDKTRLETLVLNGPSPCTRKDAWLYPAENMTDWCVATVCWEGVDKEVGY